ncbi:MAG: lysozyme inhibitor LprI family protein [Sphingomicrobium sp.]
MVMMVLAAAVLLQVAAVYPADPDCADSGDGSTMAMQACLSEQSKIWEHRLNAEYQAALKRREIEASKLRSAQRAWLKYRNANFEAYGTVQGSIRGILAGTCWRDMTRARALELHEMSWIG